MSAPTVDELKDALARALGLAQDHPAADPERPSLPLVTKTQIVRDATGKIKEVVGNGIRKRVIRDATGKIDRVEETPL